VVTRCGLPEGVKTPSRLSLPENPLDAFQKARGRHVARDASDFTTVAVENENRGQSVDAIPVREVTTVAIDVET
jgi:hypothetical protein